MSLRFLHQIVWWCFKSGSICYQEEALMFVARSPEILTMDPVKVGIVADCDQFSSNGVFQVRAQMSAMISVTSEFHISWNSVMIASPQTIMIDPRCWRIMYNCLLLISSRLATLPSDWWTSKSTLTPNRWIPLSLCPDRLLDPRRGRQQPRHISDELGGSAEDHELPGVDNECLGQKSLGHSWVAHPPLSFLQNSVSGAFITLWFCSVVMENRHFENHASKWMVFCPLNTKHKT